MMQLGPLAMIQHSQGGYVLAATDPSLLQGQKAACSLIAWSSKKLPRVSRSSAPAEVQGMSEAMEEVEYAFRLGRIGGWTSFE